jgi:hypothetical protein
MKRTSVFRTFSVGVLLLVSTVAVLLRAQDIAQRRKQLSDLIAEEWEFELRTTPEGATIIGDNRYNDRLSDVSLEGIQSFVDQSRKFLERLEAIDAAGFPEQEKLNKVLLSWNLRVGTGFFRWRPGLEGFSLKSYETPVDQFDGIHLFLPDLVAFTPFHTAQDYQNYICPSSPDTARAGSGHGSVPPESFWFRGRIRRRSTQEPEPPVASRLAKLPLCTASKFHSPATKLPSALSSSVLESKLPSDLRLAHPASTSLTGPRGRDPCLLLRSLKGHVHKSSN